LPNAGSQWILNGKLVFARMVTNPREQTCVATHSNTRSPSIALRVIVDVIVVLLFVFAVYELKLYPFNSPTNEQPNESEELPTIAADDADTEEAALPRETIVVATPATEPKKISPLPPVALPTTANTTATNRTIPVTDTHAPVPVSPVATTSVPGVNEPAQAPSPTIITPPATPGALTPNDPATAPGATTI
jgi:hypothetical protein